MEDGRRKREEIIRKREDVRGKKFLMEDGRRKREEISDGRRKREEGRQFPNPSLLFYYSFFSSAFNFLHLVTKILTISSQSPYML